MPLDQLGPAVTTAASARPVLAIVSITGELDDAAAARLLRWCEARLHLLDTGHASVSHLLIDVSHARHTRRSALTILDHARAEAGRRHVGIYLVGAGPLMANSTPEVRHRLGRWKNFPALDVARAALSPSGADSSHPTARPVDPDAIVLLATTHERLR
jgi:hypothetical protein